MLLCRVYRAAETAVSSWRFRHHAVTSPLVLLSLAGAPVFWALAGAAWSNTSTQSHALVVTVLTVTWVLARRRVARARREAACAGLGRRRTQAVAVDEQIARHEAAHVMVALAAGRTVAEIDLVPTMHADAGVSMTWPDGMNPVEREWGALQVSLAGRVVDLAGGQHEVASRHDVLNALVIVAGILSTGQRPASLDWPLTVEHLIGEASTAAAAVLARHVRLLEELTTTLVRVRAVRITGGLLASLTAHIRS